MARHEEQSIYYVNGSFCNASDARISVLDRGFLFGDAIYEVLRVHRGRAFRLKDHYDRMVSGLTALKIVLPFSRPEFDTLCAELIRRNHVATGSIYLQVSRGADSARHHAPAPNLKPTVVGVANSADFPGWKKYGEAVSVITITDTRWARCNLKTTMLLANTLAKTEAEAAGAFEAIFVAEDGTVREGSSTGLFVVLDGMLRTHPADRRILPSVTRKLVLELARAEGILLSETAVSLPELRRAEEIFLVSTTNDVCPVGRLDGHVVGSGKAGPVTSRLMRLVEETLERETA